MQYDALLLDHDGVISHPPDRTVLRSAARLTFEAAGVPDPHPDHVEGLAGGVDPDWLVDVAAGYDLDPDALWRLRDETESAAQRQEFHAGGRSLYPDVDAILSLADDGIPLGIVSTNQHETIEFVLDTFDIRRSFDTYYGREPTVESLRRKKPDPHYLELALDDLGAERALYVGDSEHDVTAAANAGIDSAFVRREHNAARDLPVAPDYEVETLTDVPVLLG